MPKIWPQTHTANGPIARFSFVLPASITKTKEIDKWHEGNNRQIRFEVAEGEETPPEELNALIWRVARWIMSDMKNKKEEADAKTPNTSGSGAQT